MDDFFILGLNLADQFPVKISDDARLRHMWAIGASGAGKSALLQNLAAHIFRTGGSFTFIDFDSDTVDEIANAIPEDRLRDVIYWDPLAEKVITFNPLQKQLSRLDRGRAADEVATTFKNMFADTWGASRLQYIFTNIILLLLDNPTTTLVDIPLLLNDNEFRRKLLKKCKNPHVKRFWIDEYAGKWTEKYRAEAIGPIENKVGQFLTTPVLSDIIGRDSSIDIGKIMGNPDTLVTPKMIEDDPTLDGKKFVPVRPKVLLCNFSSDMGDAPQRLLASMVVTVIAQEAEARRRIPKRERVPHYLIIDEFQKVDSPMFQRILAGSRKFHLGLTIANQYLEQIEDTVPAVMGNVSTTIAFRVGGTDTDLLSKHLGLQPHLLPTLDNHQAWTKVLQGSGPSLHKIATLPPPEPTGSLDTIRERAQTGYGRLRPE